MCSSADPERQLCELTSPSPAARQPCTHQIPNMVETRHGWNWEAKYTCLFDRSDSGGTSAGCPLPFAMQGCWFQVGLLLQGARMAGTKPHNVMRSLKPSDLITRDETKAPRESEETRRGTSRHARAF
ncbi:hypothetical protein AAFF_G00053720 [Aldrovandia affinis]|uniref:Uncharacterized protein n=1 Tax=Aldrovandia affinis TaxID=143900 RepID=A0AAD7S166_9TELE|nr:hypothetical protein AAFF_G00053720 [Aldrovandia affinis]